MLCINGLFPHLFCFTWIKLNDCDDVIILPLMKSRVYVFMISLYVCDSMPNGYVIVSAIHTNL